MHFRSDLFFGQIRTHFARLPNWLVYSCLQYLDPIDDESYHRPHNILAERTSYTREWRRWKPLTVGGWCSKGLVLLLLLLSWAWYTLRSVVVITTWLIGLILVVTVSLLAALYLGPAPVTT